MSGESTTTITIQVVLLIIAVAITIALIFWIYSRHKAGKPQLWGPIAVVIVVIVVLLAVAGFLSL
jgi:glucan phosphoethanolaminetransferase (alkaline phosphatase superfamily)